MYDAGAKGRVVRHSWQIRCFLWALAVIGLAALYAAPSRADTPLPLPCTGNPTAVQTLFITVDGVPTFGYYVLPPSRPRGLVVVAHGYQRAADSEIGHLLKLAQKDG